jgi:hypothetical protein
MAHLIGWATTTPTIRSFGFRFSDVVIGRIRLEGAGEEVVNRKILQWSRMGSGRGGDESTVSTVLRMSSSYQSALSQVEQVMSQDMRDMDIPLHRHKNHRRL